jgi:23S rRNA (uridine2552-2'-O)-methyltransferase
MSKTAGKSGKSGGSGKGGGKFSARGVTVRVKTAKKRTTSSTRWLQRQLNDPYVAAAKREGYRSRAAFKLLELDDQVKFLKPGMRVIDLGAAPGGWTQVAVERVKPQQSGGQVIGIDLLEVPPIAGATILQGDFMADDAPARLEELLEGPVDVVLSDMAAAATGHTQTDHIRIIVLAETAQDFAEQVLARNGTFIAKVLRGGSERELLERLKKNVAKVRHIKPPASRSDSAEMYVVATGFRGGAAR